MVSRWVHLSSTVVTVGTLWLIKKVTGIWQKLLPVTFRSSVVWRHLHQEENIRKCVKSIQTRYVQKLSKIYAYSNSYKTSENRFPERSRGKFSRLAFLAVARATGGDNWLRASPTPGTHFPPYVKYGFPERNRQGGRDNRDCFPPRHGKKNVTRWFRFSGDCDIDFVFVFLAGAAQRYSHFEIRKKNERETRRENKAVPKWKS